MATGGLGVVLCGRRYGDDKVYVVRVKEMRSGFGLARTRELAPLRSW